MNKPRVKPVWSWPFFPIVMPVTKDGLGPADMHETDRLTWEVWETGTLNSHASYDYLFEAINHALELSGDAALEPVTVQEAARVILDEVLQKSCHVAAEQRRTMVKACMKARIPSACSSARWTMVNDAIRALAEQDGK